MPKKQHIHDEASDAFNKCLLKSFKENQKVKKKKKSNIICFHNTRNLK